MSNTHDDSGSNGSSSYETCSSGSQCDDEVAHDELTTKGPNVSIEDLHHLALCQDSTTYTDPVTGFLVFSELAHLKRGYCCGSQCRHCPYGWENVKSHSRPAIVKSKDAVNIQKRLDELKIQQEEWQKQQSNEPFPPPSAKKVKKKKTGGRYGGRQTTKNVPYTRSGDSGMSSLLTGERRHKNDVVFEAMGTVDELCSVVGVAHAQLNQEASDKQDAQVSPDESKPRSTTTYSQLVTDELLEDWLLDIMSRLFDIGSHVAKPSQRSSDSSSDSDGASRPKFTADGVGGGFDKAHITELEDCIDQLTEELPELVSFILPTGAVPAAQLHVARCVCRRAERRLVALPEGTIDPNAIKYINRLSDFFFSAARFVNYRQGVEELQYRRPVRGSKQRHRIAVKLTDESKA